MLISNKKKFIFIHNPKTAGTSLTKVLLPYSDFLSRNQNKPYFYYFNKFVLSKLIGNIYAKHTPAWRVKKNVPEKWESFYTFGVVRNPYNRSYSYYMYLKNNKRLNSYVKDISFRDYIFSIRKQNWIDYQYYYFCDQNKKLIIDKVIKMEELDVQFRKLLSDIDLGLGFNIPHLNSTESKTDYFDYYDREMISEINDVFTDDFEVFDYEKIYFK